MSAVTAAGPGSRAAGYVAAVVVAALVVAGAWYQESIGFYVRMRQWDPNAAGRTVLSFLQAGKSGDQAAASRHLGTKELVPLEKKGKWVGYSLNSIAGRLDYFMADLIPATEPANPKTEFVYRGEGSALVTVPDRAGNDTVYRLQSGGGGWKIVEIRGGKVAR